MSAEDEARAIEQAGAINNRRETGGIAVYSLKGEYIGTIFPGHAKENAGWLLLFCVCGNIIGSVSPDAVVV